MRMVPACCFAGGSLPPAMESPQLIGGLQLPVPEAIYVVEPFCWQSAVSDRDCCHGASVIGGALCEVEAHGRGVEEGQEFGVDRAARCWWHQPDPLDGQELGDLEIHVPT